MGTTIMWLGIVSIFAGIALVMNESGAPLPAWLVVCGFFMLLAAIAREA